MHAAGRHTVDVTAAFAVTADGTIAIAADDN